MLYLLLQVWPQMLLVDSLNGNSFSESWAHSINCVLFPETSSTASFTKAPIPVIREFTCTWQTTIIQSSHRCLHLLKETTTATIATKGTRIKEVTCVRMDASAAGPTHSAHLRNGCFASHAEGGLCRTHAYKNICEVPSTFASL